MNIDYDQKIESLTNSVVDLIKREVASFSNFTVCYSTSTSFDNIAQGNGFILPENRSLFEIIHINPKLFEKSDDCIKFALAHEIIHAVKNEIKKTSLSEKIDPTSIRSYSIDEFKCSNDISTIVEIFKKEASKVPLPDVSLKDIVDKLCVTNKVTKITCKNHLEQAGYICTVFNHLTKNYSSFDESREMECDRLGSKALGYDSLKSKQCLGEIISLCENDFCRKLINKRIEHF